MQMPAGITPSALLDAGVKTLLLFGMVGLLGAGVFRQWIGAEFTINAARCPQITRRLRALATFAAVLTAIVSLTDVLLSLREALGYLDASLLRRYLMQTTHGRATLARLGLVAALTVFAYLPRTRIGGAVIAALSVAALTSVSIVSHNAGAGGWLPVPADVVHFAAASAWAGPILLAAVLPLWREDLRPLLDPFLKRISQVGLFAVIALTISGTYSGLLHVFTPSELVTTLYGQSLLAKLGVIFTILGIAAFNRLQMLPDFLARRDTVSLARAMYVEAVLLMLVLAVTGLLTTSPLPS